MSKPVGSKIMNKLNFREKLELTILLKRAIIEINKIIEENNNYTLDITKKNANWKERKEIYKNILNKI